MSAHEFGRGIYRINGVQCTHSGYGVFNKAETGRFIAYSARIDRTKVETLIEGCDHCRTNPFWVTIADLDAAEGVIECEYCSAMLSQLVDYQVRL